jgi:hypothetical protein
MNAEIKEKWVAALRGGYYKQTTGMLRSLGDEFCCLGVLCDITHPECWQPQDAVRPFKYKNIKRFGTVPPALMNEVGINGDQMFDLAGMNDRGSNFNQIADYIEQNL